LESRREGLEQHLRLKTRDGEHAVTLPLVGDFQTSNALVAAGLVVVSGGEVETTLRALSSLKGATGRLDLVGRTAEGVPAFVDYAHTPDAMENALTSLRPYVTGKLIVVFGCGGDRDKGKRPMMGQIAAKFADVVYVTDDNPRSENAEIIRREILVGAPQAHNVGDRATAISQAVTNSQKGDLVLVAGKGHEEGQIIGDKTIPFSDHAELRKALQKAST
jgi:UDP-N-acetylmuramoyl-L-alanyl-D-glutamate--2,6-diaminopimelate ligase